MATKTSKPTFKNNEGVKEIEIGVKKFGCIGASPPHCHPHVFLNMGKRKNILCPYCSTRYVYRLGVDPRGGELARAGVVARGASAPPHPMRSLRGQ